MAAYRTSKNGLENLCSLLGFGDEKMADVIFAAIDFEGGDNLKLGYEKSTHSEFGISTLDTRDLLPDQPSRDPSSMISTQGFVTGPLRRWLRAVRRVRLVTPERISIYNMAARVRQCLVIQDDANKGELRTLVLVQHTVKESFSMYTLRIKKKRDRWIGLRELSEELGTPFEKGDFHTASNDANCILRVLLLLAVRYQESRPCNEAQTGLLNLLRQIAKAPLPRRKSETEIQQLTTLLPTHLDDPNVPVDTSSFAFKRTQKEKWHRRMQQHQATFAAYKKSLGLSSETEDTVEVPACLPEQVLKELPCNLSSNLPNMSP